jgi:hypothetical protein
MYRHINHLPEEILREILNAVLDIQDSTFSDPNAPFGRNALSTSRVLLVCRRWLRVATPLLYRTVVLRSTTQARSLAFVLEHNPKIGKYVRKLRLEGGYGSSIRTVLKLSPNVTDLYMSVTFRSSDRSSGLCQGLDFLNPSRLIIYDSEDSKETTNHDAVMNALCKALPNWKRLVSSALSQSQHRCLIPRATDDNRICCFIPL